MNYHRFSQAIFGMLLIITSLNAPARELVHNATGIYAEGIGADITLNGPGGKAVSLSDFKGQVVLLYFGYTSCPDICPSSLSIMKRAMKQLGEEARKVQGIFVTVDPARDGGTKLQEYAQYFHPNFIGLEGSEEAVRAAARSWGVAYRIEEGNSAAGYLIAHSDYIYLLDKQGELAGLFNSKSMAGDMTKAIQVVLQE